MIPGFSYKVEATEGYARAGTLETPHGTVKTPIFMPVGTQATVKGITREQILDIGSQIILANTYHLEMRPGSEIVKEFGGVHGFANVDMPILTDSGGFQVFSLGQAGIGEGVRRKENLVKITEEGVRFHSHLDGTRYMFTPESVMQIESNLGGDIIMAFDECSPGTSSRAYAKKAMDLTHRWALRCVTAHEKIQKERIENGQLPQALFPIAQGVIYEDLRVESVRFIRDLPTLGMAIGGLSVGESKEDMLRILDTIAPELPEAKPRYLMGVGTPEDLIEGIYRGIDMFDCVLPTRLGRHGVAFTSFGNLKIPLAQHQLEKKGIPMKPGFETMVSKNYSLGYLRHLIKSGESLGGQLLSLHNLEYLIRISTKAREAIVAGTYENFRKEFWVEYRVNKI
ncbi:MAG: tRNA guanosine(34) transglycosylase Tgt [Candidatus Gracilibacteria bacterium]|nr:tRNA guanosine(34) transglycosylase Tgt [Candidatus Gracilibacteria bacterium]